VRPTRRDITSHHITLTLAVTSLTREPDLERVPPEPPPRAHAAYTEPSLQRLGCAAVRVRMRARSAPGLSQPRLKALRPVPVHASIAQGEW
jgi:hypothetical protein